MGSPFGGWWSHVYRNETVWKLFKEHYWVWLQLSLLWSSSHLTKIGRKQSLLLPDMIDDYIDENNPERLLDLKPFIRVLMQHSKDKPSMESAILISPVRISPVKGPLRKDIKACHWKHYEVLGMRCQVQISCVIWKSLIDQRPKRKTITLILRGRRRIRKVSRKRAQMIE